MTRFLLRTLLTLALASLAGVAVVSSPAQAAELCGKWDTTSVNGGEYVVQNNVWGADTAQCIDVNGTSFAVTRSDHNLPTNGAPASYPSIYKGCHWENCTVDSGMPVRVADLGTATSTWSTSTPSSGAWNVAYDLWFNTTATPGAPDGAELMIWLNSDGGVQPAGSIVASNVAIAGATWDVWRAQMDWNYIAYQRTSPTLSVDALDLRQFIRDATERGAVQSAWYLMAVEAGFELWQQGAGLATNAFSTAVSRDAAPPDPSPSPTVSPTPTTECSVQYVIRDQWNTGFTADVTVTNLGDPVDGWTLDFSFPADQRVYEGWSATWSQDGQRVQARNLDWNAQLAPGASTTIGFNASHSGANPEPTSFSLNGSTCASV